MEVHNLMHKQWLSTVINMQGIHYTKSIHVWE